MTSIQLTEEQKAKLLEMCKVLFPEYKYWKLHDGSCDSCTENTLDYSLEEKPQWNSWDRIHWFEFCCKKLTFQIYNFNIGKTKTTYSTFVAECIITTTFHPIDYLYEEFLKLNN